MSYVSGKNLLIGLVMVAAALASIALTPSKKLAETKINLEQLVPLEFGDWQIDPTITPLEVSPEVKAQLSKIYNETLSRTYVNKQGERVMLSIAYGGDQSKSLQVHKPETCYVAQGFNVKNLGDSPLLFGNLQIKARHLIATLGNRSEPITYWMRVGNTTVYGGLGQAINRYKMGLKGYIPDGLLFRVSSLDSDKEQAFRTQEKFIDALLSAIEPSSRSKLIGTESSSDLVSDAK